MTPHSHPSRRPAPRRVQLARTVRRALVVGTAVAAVATVAPAVTHAVEVDADATDTWSPWWDRVTTDIDAPGSAVPQSGAGSDAGHDVAVLADVYAWGEVGARVERLQGLLGMTPDGTYGPATRAAHLAALAWFAMPTDAVPSQPGPDPSAWAALRECESNGDYTITNPSGKYRGAYQFGRSTWDSVASRTDPSLVGVDPAAASPADQDAMALALYLERGASPWPHCGRHLR